MLFGLSLILPARDIVTAKIWVSANARYPPGGRLL
jgi:hypothetical protein